MYFDGAYYEIYLMFFTAVQNIYLTISVLNALDTFENM